MNSHHWNTHSHHVPISTLSTLLSQHWASAAQVLREARQERKGAKKALKQVPPGPMRRVVFFLGPGRTHHRLGFGPTGDVETSSEYRSEYRWVKTLRLRPATTASPGAALARCRARPVQRSPGAGSILELGASELR